jgi:hypothetical protein
MALKMSQIIVASQTAQLAFAAIAPREVRTVQIHAAITQEPSKDVPVLSCRQLLRS